MHSYCVLGLVYGKPLHLTRTGELPHLMGRLDSPHESRLCLGWHVAEPGSRGQPRPVSDVVALLFPAATGDAEEDGGVPDGIQTSKPHPCVLWSPACLCLLSTKFLGEHLLLLRPLQASPAVVPQTQLCLPHCLN